MLFRSSKHSHKGESLTVDKVIKPCSHQCEKGTCCINSQVGIGKDIPQENLEKCRYTYQGNETYAFLMSDKYIMALYTHCLVARKETAIQGMQIEGFTEKEYGMVRLENVGDVLFQALLFDDVKFQTGNIIGELLTIYVLGREIY